MTAEKPAYRVPSMRQIAKIKPNGLVVASTFSGAGGSSLGYRMAGFDVRYASEFVPIAQESYKANAPTTHVDGRDVKKVKGTEILSACRVKVGELDLLDGSPPCQAFSSAGRKEKGWGTDRHYEHGASQKNEELFFDYVRLLDETLPKTFVAENVRGLITGSAKGFFIEILQALKKVGYRVEAKLLDAQWLGVPQARQRVVFVGVREDLEMDPVFPSPLPYRYSVREAIPWIDRCVHDTRGSFQSGGDITNRPSVTIMSSPFDAHHFKVEIGQGTGPGSKQNKGKTFSPDAPIPTIMAGNGNGPHQFEIRQNSNATHSRKGERRSLNDPAPTILSRRSNLDLVHTGQNIQVGDSVPENVGASLEGYALSPEWDKLSPGEQSAKYFSLIKADPGQPCPTITASGGGGEKIGSPGGVAGVAHPFEKRKFSILEVKRLCSFPDDFVLKGTYGQQWERLGNSVPPVMMRAVAEAIRDRVLIPARARSGPASSRSSGRKPKPRASR